MYEGKDAFKTVDDYIKFFDDTNRAKAAIKQKEKTVRQRLLEKIQPEVNESDKTRN